MLLGRVDSADVPGGTGRSPCPLRVPAAAALAVLGVMVGAAGAWNPSAWFDEAATLSAVRRPVGDVLDLVGHVDAVHALYYLSVKGWVLLAGDSLISVRLFSALGLGVTSALTFLLAERLATPTAAWFAGVSVVLLPGLSWAGLEARSFAWAAAFAVLSTYLLLRAQEREGARAWAAYAVALVVSIWWFLFSVAMVVAHGLALLLCARRFPRGWVVAASAAMLATLPLLALAYEQRRQIDHIDYSSGELAVRVLGAQTFTGPGFRPHDQGGWVVAGGVTAALVTMVVVSGIVRSRRFAPPSHPLQPLLWTWAVVPALAIAGPHLWGAQTYQVRYLTYSVPAVAILLGTGLATYAGIWRAVLAAALVLAAAPVILSLHSTDAKSGEDYRALAALAKTRNVDAALFAGAGSRSIKVAYPDSFRGIDDLLLRSSPVDSDTLFGRNRPPRSLRAVQVAGKVVVLYQRSEKGPDRYARALNRLGCERVAETVRRRYTATVLRCPAPVDR